LAAVWGSQFRELQADRAVYDKLKSHRDEISSSTTSAETQQYLDQYAFALDRAESIVRNTSAGALSKVNNQNENTIQQQLAMYLHTMRGLRAKLGVV
jgi:hypothetical protein